VAALRSTGSRRGDEPAFVFDPDRCTGCEACRVACGIENGDGLDTGWRQILTLNPGRHPALPTSHLSLACNHCAEPACMLGCPAAAYHRDEATGAVLLDPDKCMGCRYCSWVCPYDAPRYDEAAGVMSKCTFCSHRLAAGAEPACIEACPTDALTLGTRADAVDEPTGVGLEAWGLGPALAVRSSRRTAAPSPGSIASPAVPPRGALSVDSPVQEAAAGWTGSPGSAARVSYGLAASAWPPASASGRSRPRQPLPPPKIRLRAEWALVLFTLAIPALLAWLAASLARPERVSAPWTPWAFLGAGALAMGLSTLHLGRPSRAWRAILNLRTSPLSREIALSSAFLAAGFLHLLLPAGSPLRLTAGAVAVLLGAGTLLAIDAVYRAIPRDDARRIHSADAWLTGALLVGLAVQVPLAWAPAALLKIVLTLLERTLPAPLLVLRLLLLAAALTLATPGVLWPASSLGPWWVPLLPALAGELLNRAAFYHRLEPASPARTMAAQMTAAAGRRFLTS